MSFVVFDTEEYASKHVVLDIAEYGYEFVDDTFDGTGALADSWWIHQGDHRVSGTTRESGYFDGDILVGENDANITEWYLDLSGAFHYQIVKFPTSGSDEYIIRGVGIGPTTAPLDNLPHNSGFAFSGVMAHVDNNFTSKDYEFTVVGHRSTSPATVETKSTKNSLSSVASEGDNVFGLGVTHGDIRIILNSDNTIEFAYSVLNADSWVPVNGTGSTPTGANKPTFGSTVCIGLIIYAEGTAQLPYTGTVDSFQLTTLLTGDGWLNRNYFWDNI